jgi:uncharacterized membrane protein YhdT
MTNNYLSSQKSKFKMNKMNLLEFVFWLLVVLLIAYGIGKALGYIRSPEWVEASPYVITGILLAYLKLYIKKDIKSALDNSLKNFKVEFDKIKDETIVVISKAELLIDLMKTNFKRKK